eukprot:1309710-Rhodomonas_salina.4
MAVFVLPGSRYASGVETIGQYQAAMWSLYDIHPVSTEQGVGGAQGDRAPHLRERWPDCSWYGKDHVSAGHSAANAETERNMTRQMLRMRSKRRSKGTFDAVAVQIELLQRADPEPRDHQCEKCVHEWHKRADRGAIAAGQPANMHSEQHNSMLASANARIQQHTRDASSQCQPPSEPPTPDLLAARRRSIAPASLISIPHSLSVFSFAHVNTGPANPSASVFAPGRSRNPGVRTSLWVDVAQRCQRLESRAALDRALHMQRHKLRIEHRHTRHHIRGTAHRNT